MRSLKSLLRAVAGSVVPFAGVVLAFAAAGPTSPERVSIGDGSAVPDGPAYEGTVTGNGRYAAFYSSATNLLPDSGNSTEDVFVRDRKKGTTALASPNIVDGGEGNGASQYPVLSDNGRFVLFFSDATDLVEGDDQENVDIFLTDMKTGQVTRLSEDDGGFDGDASSALWGAALSKNGRYAVYYSVAGNLAPGGIDDNGFEDIFLYDRVKGTTTLISTNLAGNPANGHSAEASISPNGRFVAYYTRASDIAATDPTGPVYDICVYDTKKKTNTILPLGTALDPADGDAYGPVVSDNGRYVAFYSSAENLVGAEDTNGRWDVFLSDRKTGETKRLSVANDGTEADNYSYYPAMSASGKVVLFLSPASNLDTADGNGGDNDVFRFLVKKGILTLVSKAADGTGGDSESITWGACLSSNGKYVAFTSGATNFDSEGVVDADDTFVLKLGK